jgi:hypothetical protein
VFLRQIAQFVISNFVVEFQAGISEGQHEDIVKESNRQFLTFASSSIAGNHVSA